MQGRIEVSKIGECLQHLSSKLDQRPSRSFLRSLKSSTPLGFAFYRRSTERCTQINAHQNYQHCLYSWIYNHQRLSESPGFLDLLSSTSNKTVVLLDQRLLESSALTKIPTSTTINTYQIIVHSDQRPPESSVLFGISAFLNVTLALRDSYIYIYENCKPSGEDRRRGGIG